MKISEIGLFGWLNIVAQGLHYGLLKTSISQHLLKTVSLKSAKNYPLKSAKTVKTNEFLIKRTTYMIFSCFSIDIFHWLIRTTIKQTYLRYLVEFV